MNRLARMWWGVPAAVGVLLGGCASSVERSVDLVANGKSEVTALGPPCRVQLDNLGPGDLTYTPETRSGEGGDWQPEPGGTIGPRSMAVIGRSHDLRVRLDSAAGTSVRIKATAQESLAISSPPAGL